MGEDTLFKEIQEEFYTETCKVKEGKKKEIQRGWSFQSLNLITSQPLPLKLPFNVKGIREYIEKTCCESG